MNEAGRQAIILALMRALRDRDSWCGETHMQKSCHFLQEGLEVPLDLDFIMYKHGPFSFELRELLGELRAANLLTVEAQPPYGPRLQPSDSGLAMLERFPKTLGRYSRQIEYVADKLAPYDVLALERLGTALFVLKELPASTPIEQAAAIARLKPRVDKSAGIAALEEVQALLEEAAGL